ncbi:MAG TPA: hypothetical protein VF516_00900 [Kofleriaceae bacterium]
MTRRTFGGRARACGRVGPVLGPVIVAALAALAASCDNLSPKVSGVSSHDRGSGPIVIGHF